MLLCVLTEAYAALKLHTMHRAHLSYPLRLFAEFYSFVASLTSTPQKETHVRQHLISLLAAPGRFRNVKVETADFTVRVTSRPPPLPFKLF